MSQQNQQNPEHGGEQETGPDSDPSILLEADLRKLQEERDSLFEQLARVSADFQNARKRLEADKQQQVQYANSKLISSLLPVLDTFERALQVDPDKAEAGALLKGLRIMYDQLAAALKSQSVEEIAPEVGEPFNPNLHEAMMQRPDERFEEPSVVQVLQKGYMLHGRTLRPAKVIVSA